MAAKEYHVQLIANRFADQEVTFLIDESSTDKWYVGVANKKGALDSEEAWMLFEIVSVGTVTKIHSHHDLFDHSWNERAAITYS